MIMPIYEYECSECRLRFDKRKQFKDIDHDMLSKAIEDYTTGNELFLLESFE